MLQSNRTLVSLLSLVVSASLMGCMAELDENDEFVAEDAQALGVEICNGIDDDEDFMIDEGGACDSDKYVYAEHEYLVGQDQLNQTTAQAMCMGRGMNLARIQSAPENDFLRPFAVGTQGIWIDLNDRAVEGSYRYENGLAATWLNWSTYEPNNYNNEDCGMMWDTGKWNDMNCTWTNKTFCELLDPVTWTNLTYVSVVGTQLTKTYGQSWEAGANSVQTIPSGDGFVQFTTDEVEINGEACGKVFGLTSDPQGNNWQTMDYAIALTHDAGTLNPRIEIRENGGFAAVSTNGTWTPGDVFRIEIVAGEVRYLRNGALMHAHTTTPVYPLYADAVLGGKPGTTVGDARLHACQPNESACIVRNMWTRSGNVLAVDGRVKKMAGQAWEAGAATIASVPSTGAYAKFSAPADGSLKAAGFAVPHSGYDVRNIKYGIFFGKDSLGNATATPMKDGGTTSVCPGVGVAHNADSDEFRVELTGTNTVVFKRNGTTFCIYTASIPHPSSVNLDVAIRTLGAEVRNLALGTL
ncbi:MAG TPA: C-type lectin domain-containing protein [Polyangium sp.]|nr:C-type lectin domain-containing protein [Polyangium sp.]